MLEAVDLSPECGAGPLKETSMISRPITRIPGQDPGLASITVPLTELLYRC